MLRKFLSLIAAVTACLAPSRMLGFSLLGPYAPWMTTQIGYNLPPGSFSRPVPGFASTDGGGPMNLGEGYRWPSPVLTYAYDASFVNYFGTNGIAAIESAIAVFNGLTNADAMSDALTEYPMETLRVNSTAAAVGLVDIRTYVMSLILEQLGLAAPERFVFTLRSDTLDSLGHFASGPVIMRNFDPVTFEPTNVVNATAYTYQIEVTYNDTSAPPNPIVWEPVEYALDPLKPAISTVAGFTGVNGGTIEPRGEALAYTPGGFFGGLTRDDVGGLRYLLRSKSYAVETLFTDVIAGGGGISFSSSGSVSSSPWTPIFSIATNTSTAANSPWVPVILPTGGTTNANGTVTVTNTTTAPAVNTALRPGAGKIQFVRVNYDSLLSTTVTPYLASWVDRYVTNGVLRAQTVSRRITTPDLIFTAGDIDGTGNFDALGLIARTIPATTFQNNALLNTAGGALDTLYGPGTAQPGMAIAFNKIYNYWVTFAGGNQANSFTGLTWGSFDGSTNTPVVFPTGASIKGLQKLVLGR